MGITDTWHVGPSEWSILVHGGAGSRKGSRQMAAVAGCRTASETAARVLSTGGSALDAVELAVRCLEDDPTFNAGTGGALCSDGSMELDAAIMAGTDLRAGAVCALPPYRNPIAIARAVLQEGAHVLYAGAGAEAFARAHGFDPADPAEMVTDGAREELERARSQGRATLWAGNTVGAVARDSGGRLAAATSTGGLPGQARGRVGDSPIVGAGTAADDERGACSVTGDGDAILRVSMAADALFRMACGSAPELAACEALELLAARTGAPAGLILVHPDGALAAAFTTPTMSWAACQPGGAWHA
ncbi:MAG: isoaspartyl peptidase/L-asparaginase [Myxococcales bacterium]|nr:isoaspartyl peptidase/L-asparaginase [Myxococcales bacterium]MDD9966070.1 isoaspartyl peptidase/L-asparaginase [Myxococcales bacterium]